MRPAVTTRLQLSLAMCLLFAGAGQGRADPGERGAGEQVAGKGAGHTLRLEGIPPPLVPELCPPDLHCPAVLGGWEGPLPPSYLKLSLPEQAAGEQPFDSGSGGAPSSLRRRLGGAIGTAGFYGALYAWAYFAWYRGQKKNESIMIRWEGAFGGDTYGGGADKLGHYFSSYAIARGTTEFLVYMGWKPWFATLLGGLLSLTWFTAIELKDGMHLGYGFSPEDMIANTLGVLTSALMYLWPGFDDLIDVRLYYRPSKPFTHELLVKKNVDVAEDYTGSTYMMAFRLMGVPAIRHTRWLRPLRYIDLLVGYNARGFLPRPKDGRWRDRELFFGFGLNLMAILEDVAPGTRLYKTINVMQEFFHLTPVARFVRFRAYNAQPAKKGH
ncbi:MAG: DUF2279 domain-containing protein [Polyangia bacterium]|jgi:hypothetical protein|nr:DUF2279 domain-containing protein [Polyangia bacterium]